MNCPCPPHFAKIGCQRNTWNNSSDFNQKNSEVFLNKGQSLWSKRNTPKKLSLLPGKQVCSQQRTRSRTQSQFHVVPSSFASLPWGWLSYFPSHDENPCWVGLKNNQQKQSVCFEPRDKDFSSALGWKPLATTDVCSVWEGKYTCKFFGGGEFSNFCTVQTAKSEDVFPSGIFGVYHSPFASFSVTCIFHWVQEISCWPGFVSLSGCNLVGNSPIFEGKHRFRDYYGPVASKVPRRSKEHLKKRIDNKNKWIHIKHTNKYRTSQ